MSLKLKYRLQNIDSCWTYIEDNSIKEFITLFSNETLSKVFRLIIFSSELLNNKIFLNKLKNEIDIEAQKRKFDCFQPIKDNSEKIIDVLYCDKKIIYLN